MQEEEMLFLMFFLFCHEMTIKFHWWETDEQRAKKVNHLLIVVRCAFSSIIFSIFYDDSADFIEIREQTTETL